MLFYIETESVQLVDFQTADSCFINANISEKKIMMKLLLFAVVSCIKLFGCRHIVLTMCILFR